MSSEYQYYPQKKGDLRPSDQNLISHRIESKPNGIRYLDGSEGMDHVVVFEYPDRVVEHDGVFWRIRETRKPEPNIFLDQ